MVNGKFLIYHLRGWDIDEFELIKKYKEVGFDEVAFYCNNTSPIELKQTINFARSIGLEVNYIHGPMKNNSSIWIENQAEEYMANVISFIEMAGELKIKYFVMHPAGKEWISFSKIGIENYKKLLKVCKKNNVIMLLENLRTVDNMLYIFEHIKSKNLAFCLDTGHANVWCYKPIELVKKFKNKIMGVHIHDNDGEYCSDQHLIPFKGSIDFEQLMPELNKFYNGPISLEIDNFKTEEYRYADLDEYLKDALSAAKKLQNLCKNSEN